VAKVSLIVSLAVSLLAGCASTPQPIGEAPTVPESRVFYGDTAAEGAPFATVVFVRDVGFAGAGVYNHLFINGKKAASLDPGEKVAFRLPPGEYLFGAVPTTVLGLMSVNNIEQTLQAGRTYRYRMKVEGHTMRATIERDLPL
jgi:hypothetical protein